MQGSILEGYQLSPQQKRLWLLQKANGARPYLAQCLIEVDGAVDRDALREALGTVINRHEILRTTFHRPAEMETPVQVITNKRTPSISIDDLSELEPGDRERRVESLLAEAITKPFDLEAGPLLRLALMTLSESRTLMSFVMPSLCGDSETVSNLVAEICRAYDATLRKEELPDSPMQYADLSEWQNELYASDDADKAREYWKKRVITDALRLRLPFEAEVTQSLNFTPLYQRSTVCHKVLREIKELTHQCHSSIPVFFLTCWRILLGRQIGQNGVVVGAAFDGRNYDELRGAIGLFARYLPVHFLVSDTSSFIDALNRATDAISEIEQWQESFTWSH